MTPPRLLQPGRLPSSRCIVMSDNRSGIDFVLHAGRPRKKLSSRVSGAMFSGLLGIFIFCGSPISSAAQSGSTTPYGRDATGQAASSNDTYWRRFAVGFGASILAHESAHIASSLLMGFHPHVRLDRGRPTIFSGIDSRRYPHKQFIFSAAGLTTQAIINEAILDVPHQRGGPIERGILAGGIATTLFYITFGRNG